LVKTTLALDMVASCSHPHARWLASVFAKAREEEAREARTDALGVFFAFALGPRQDLAPLRRSAEAGCAIAQAFMAGRMDDEEERFKFALLAANQGERDGFYWLGYFFRDAIGCEWDADRAKHYFRLASEHGTKKIFGLSLLNKEKGDAAAMWQLAQLLDESDPQHFRWSGLAASLGPSFMFLSRFAIQVELFNRGSGSATVMFAIGKALRGQVGERHIFEGFNGSRYSFDSLIGPAKQAIAFYEARIQATINAMRAWTLVGIKLKVVKDIRKLIAKLIWDSREEALFRQ
jgi:hypothetical protein